MDVLETIRTRRTAGNFRPDLPPREAIEEILDAATRAPNHYLNEPWHFYVLAGEARERFGEAMAEDVLRSMPSAREDQRKAIADAQRKKAVRSPVIIAIAVDAADGRKLIHEENVAAGAAAIQNLLLAAHAKGLAAKWSTGPSARSEHIKKFFDLTPEHHILAFLYVGYAADEVPVRPRTSYQEKTVWQGWPSAS